MIYTRVLSRRFGGAEPGRADPFAAFGSYMYRDARHGRAARPPRIVLLGPRTCNPRPHERLNVWTYRHRERLTCETSTPVSVWTPRGGHPHGHGAGGDSPPRRGGGLRDVSAPRPFY